MGDDFMKKLIYPAIFHNEDGGYWVEFPDLKGCYSSGDTLDEIFYNAKESLAAYCTTLLEQNKRLNAPTDISKIPTAEDGFVSLIEADLIKSSQAVKKTLTIPSWLNDAALEKNINFSQTLQNALIEQLNLA
jgi:predicted RNase H-like HicB family nuclease